MPSERLTPQSITLRLKHHKSTTLLAVQPSTPFRDIKAQLLHVLKLTHPSGSIPSGSSSSSSSAGMNADPAARASIRIPDSENDVLLARPRDPFDAGLGWVRMYTSAEEAAGEADEDGEEEDGDVVGNANADVQVFETPKQAALKDGAVLAFKFRAELARRGGAAATTAAGEEEEDEDMVDEGVEMDEDEQSQRERLIPGQVERWDVVLPSFEDTTGVVNEGDLGVLKNYTG